MKKTLSILLAVVLMFALALPVFAEDVSESDVSGETSKVVTATREEGSNVTEVATVYYVTVEWNVNSQLNYKMGNTTYNWDPATTAYIPSTADPKWEGSASVEITVTNRSNDQIKADAKWESESGITAACTFEDDGSVTVDSAATGTDLTQNQLTGEAQTKKITGTVEVSAGSIAKTNDPVGTVTLNISKVN